MTMMTIPDFTPVQMSLQDSADLIARRGDGEQVPYAAHLVAYWVEAVGSVPKEYTAQIIAQSAVSSWFAKGSVPLESIRRIGERTSPGTVLRQSFEAGMPAYWPQYIHDIDPQSAPYACAMWLAGVRPDNIKSLTATANAICGGQQSLVLSAFVAHKPEVISKVLNAASHSPSVIETLSLRRPKGGGGWSVEADILSFGNVIEVISKPQVTSEVLILADRMKIPFNVLDTRSREENLLEDMLSINRSMNDLGLSYYEVRDMRELGLGESTVAAYAPMEPSLINLVLNELRSSNATWEPRAVVDAWTFVSSKASDIKLDSQFADSVVKLVARVALSPINTLDQYTEVLKTLRKPQDIDCVLAAVSLSTRGLSTKDIRRVMAMAVSNDCIEPIVESKLYDPEVAAQYMSGNHHIANHYHLAQFIVAGGSPTRLAALHSLDVPDSSWASLARVPLEVVWEKHNPERQSLSNPPVVIGGIPFYTPDAPQSVPALAEFLSLFNDQEPF